MNILFYPFIMIAAITEVSPESSADTAKAGQNASDTIIVSMHGRIVSVDLIECSFVLKTEKEEYNVFTDSMTSFPENMKFADMKRDMNVSILCRIVNAERFALEVKIVDDLKVIKGIRVQSDKPCISSTSIKTAAERE